MGLLTVKTLHLYLKYKTSLPIYANKQRELFSDKEIIEYAKATLLTEAKAVEALVSSVNSDFIESTRLIHNSEGRLILTGIGKSAVIAMKIVATLNSTGTPAIFMHAADAIHGDLGIVQPHDIVLCISKSGSSPEIQSLLPFIQKRGNKIIGMTAEKSSFLAKTADYILYTPVEKEACPNNLAPTTSTTVQLAMGDALAVCLLQMKNFKADDFAQHHPGGALGKKLFLTLGDLVEKNAKPKVTVDSSVKNVIQEITEKRLGTTVVMKEEEICGIVTDGDIRRMLEKHDNIGKLTAKDIMSANPKKVAKNTLATDAMKILQTNKISQIVVTDEKGRYHGIVHFLDLTKEGIVA